MSRKTLRIATYNIHRCIGTDKKFDPHRIRQCIENLNADVIALQEVETKHHGGMDILRDISSRTGMQAIAGPTMFTEDSNYGNSILCRYEPESIEHVNISVRKREPRGAISINIVVAGKKVHLIATHLGLSSRERNFQVQRLLQLVKEQRADITIVMGDMNEWLYCSYPLRVWRHEFITVYSPATFPSYLPLLALDKVLVKPASLVKSITAYKSKLTKQASDHLPIIAEIALL